MRTNKGPQRQWLHHIRKLDSPLCDCSDTPQSGDHIVFSCPLHRIARTALLGPGNHSWQSLDHPRYDQNNDDDEEQSDLVEEFFGYIFAHFNRGHHRFLFWFILFRHSALGFCTPLIFVLFSLVSTFRTWLLHTFDFHPCIALPHFVSRIALLYCSFCVGQAINGLFP